MKALLRRFLRRATLCILRWSSSPCPLTANSRCLVIAPHPDDETLGCAGLILTRRLAGLPVNIIHLTDGAASHPGHPQLCPADLAQLRRAEALRAMAVLEADARSLQFLNATDGTLAHLNPAAFADLARRLSALIAPLAPTEVLVTCRDDGSSEHTAAFNLTVHALQLVGLAPRLLEYPVWAYWSPRRLFRLRFTSRRVWRLSFPLIAARKREALDCYVTQIKPTPPWTQAVLPPGFAECFGNDEEFFFDRSS